jgi:SIR2-like domain
MPDDPPPRDLSDAVAEGRALVICGAGISRAATREMAPGWAQLIEDALAKAAKLKGGTEQHWVKACKELLTSNLVEDWLNAANTIQQKLAPPNGPFRDFLICKLAFLKATRPTILEAIKKIASRNRIATTNYDHLISEALGWDRTDWTDPQRVVEALRDHRKAVWHIHGDFDRPNSVIFSQHDYDRIAAQELPQFVQKSAGLTFTLVFVGCSASGLSDDNVGKLLDWMRVGFSGLGDKHFVLIPDDNKDQWPDGVTLVRFGGLVDLPSYLGKLAPASTLPFTLPPDPKMIGRAGRLEQLVKEILERARPIVVLGPFGIGKTTLTLAAAYDPRIIARFGSRRLLVNCEPLEDAEGLLRLLAANLGLNDSSDASDVEASIKAACAEVPAFAILDDLDKIWGQDMAGTRSLLGRLAEIFGLRLVLTFSDKPPRLPGAGAFLMQVGPLGEDEARALFLRHAGDHLEGDPALNGLLYALDFHPELIEQLAESAAGRLNLRGVLDRTVFIRQHGHSGVVRRSTGRRPRAISGSRDPRPLQRTRRV